MGLFFWEYLDHFFGHDCDASTWSIKFNFTFLFQVNKHGEIIRIDNFVVIQKRTADIVGANNISTVSNVGISKYVHCVHNSFFPLNILLVKEDYFFCPLLLIIFLYKIYKYTKNIFLYRGYSLIPTYKSLIIFS